MLNMRLKTEGLSLIEMSCCFAIIAILSGGIGQTLLSGVKMHLISGSEAAQQRVAVVFTRLLREDLRGASDVTVSANGLTLVIAKGANQVRYQYVASTKQMARMINNAPGQSFPDNNDRNTRGLQLSCTAQCFKLDAVTIPSQSFSNKKLNLAKITITDSKTKLGSGLTEKWKAYSFGPNEYQIASGSLFN
ncbi:hypothetical protein [Vampirovibrio sp.]|uniref:hypothetical protein n=1 Tax=Vampirovibrio sp. TaxID=2717857 RepID=UPI003593C38A